MHEICSMFVTISYEYNVLVILIIVLNINDIFASIHWVDVTGPLIIAMLQFFSTV